LDRRQVILRHIGTGTRGIEIAPWFKPIVPPDGERDVVVLDVFDRPNLVARAKSNPNIDDTMIPQISEVDLVGSACEIAELVCARFGAAARFDFVVSSHNLEHLPDPVRFLRGCEALLTSGGMVAMAVPDKRACFDFFRPHSGTGELLEAFHERREHPTFAQTFSQSAYQATLCTGTGNIGAFTIDENPSQVALIGDVVQQYARWLKRLDANDTQYCDTHCWTFTPSSLELILTELILLGLINFEIVTVTQPVGCEFYVHLRKRPEDVQARDGLAERRELLLRQTVDEVAHVSRETWKLHTKAKTEPRRLFLVHIPKTAGTTINESIAKELGKDRVRTHIESAPGLLTNIQTLSTDVEYVSGHHRLPDVLNNIDRKRWFVFAILRNPVRHLVSHLKWVKSLGDPDNELVRTRHSATIQAMANRLWEIDLNDVGRIHRFIHEEFDEAKQLFDNCQVRYLTKYCERPINAADAAASVEALGSMNYVGFTEDLQDAYATIARILGATEGFTIIPHSNESRLDEAVNLGDPVIGRFYREAVRWDAHLYTAAKKRLRGCLETFSV